MALIVIRPGMLTTVQDLGRWGWQGSGVPVAGPMDAYSHRLANRLVGNTDDAAALEVTLLGPELEADAEALCAVAGARFDVTVNGDATDSSSPFVVPVGGRVRFGARRAGSRATLAVRGGLDVPKSFESRATSIISRTGPFGGRPLLPGDVLPIGTPSTEARLPAGRALSMPDGGACVRIIRGPHDAMFMPGAFDALVGSRFVVTAQSNRMGYRLEGPVIRHAGGADILSDATPIGSLQVPSSGQPILLMADRQTTGGYPKIGTVITADLPIAGQLAPGDWIAFVECTREEAIDALMKREAALSGADR
ncbi:MAG: biotin-dependent carboxyltransferase family protein [Acidobacteriota bacterium]|nr:biotin-dependent carboxyltransferase family protein [Acidobacteriota bacterium]